ncbi:MAG: MBL fold metallo-hydrolase [Candidatus Aenigmarchaeota archaeon]|nr:MBL fold metallo-hydrolase [Candidatus Aenigmarchaeota archaeon]
MLNKKNIIILCIFLALSLFLVIWYFAPPSEEARKFSNKIDQYQPEILTKEREDLLLEFDNFAFDYFPILDDDHPLFAYSYLFSDLHKFYKLRFDKLYAEIKNTQVPDGQIKLWYVYNMGVVAKTKNLTIGFDLAHKWIDFDIPKLADQLDILIISHPHQDHYDSSLVKRALSRGVAVVLPSGKIKEEWRKPIRSDPKGKELKEIFGNSENLISMDEDETKVIKQAKITAFAAEHGKGELPVPTRWFFVEIDGFTILHTDDAELIGSETGDAFKKIPQGIDIFLMDIRSPNRLREISFLKPKIIIPLHHWEIFHGKPKTKGEGDFRKILSFKDEVHQQIPTSKVIPLIWGESISLESESQT